MVKAENFSVSPHIVDDDYGDGDNWNKEVSEESNEEDKDKKKDK